MNRTMRGFTLIEAMIVVAIIGLIAAFGYPAYRDQVMKSRRAEGMGELLELADRLERYYSDKGTYAGATPGNIFHATTTKGYYQLSIESQDATSFKILATPTLSSSQANDKCKTFILYSDGRKEVKDGSLSADDCWK